MSTFLPVELPAERVAARIALVGDTHIPQRCPALPPVLFDLFAGADLVLHTGDVGELEVLDQLSRIAPVVAVHGNDDSRAAQRELPYQQVVTAAGVRILIWHSHYPDRIDEMESRRDDQIIPKLGRSVARAQRAGARVALFGHWHIPLVYEVEGVTVVNPGALAPGNAVSRLLRHTVAWLFLRDDGEPFVCHIDLAQPDRPFVPRIDWPAGFLGAHRQFNESILAAEFTDQLAAINRVIEEIGFDCGMPPLLRVARRCWAGKQEQITLADWVSEVERDADLPVRVKAEYLKRLHEFPL